MTTAELMKCKEALIQKKAEQAERQGKIEQIESELNEKYGGCDESIKLAKEKELSELKEKYDEKFNEFKEEYHELLSTINSEGD